MREIRTSGLMSGEGKRDGHRGQHPRPSFDSTAGPICRRTDVNRRQTAGAAWRYSGAVPIAIRSMDMVGSAIELVWVRKGS
jgi:hypothetical protein